MEEWLRFLDCCWIQGHRKQVNLIFNVFENGRRGLIQTIWGAETFFPAKALHVAIYLAAIIQTANSPSPVIHAFYSLKWVHNIGDQISPTDSQLVKNILEAGKRRLSKPICKKEPMTIELIQKVYESLITEENAYNMRSICVILVAYAGFLRSQELLGIRRSDIIFDTLYMSIFIEKSKTDIYRDGAWVIISRTNSKLVRLAIC